MWNCKPEAGQVIHSWSGCQFNTGPLLSDITPDPFHFNGTSHLLSAAGHSHYNIYHVVRSLFCPGSRRSSLAPNLIVAQNTTAAGCFGMMRRDASLKIRPVRLKGTVHYIEKTIQRILVTYHAEL